MTAREVIDRAALTIAGSALLAAIAVGAWHSFRTDGSLPSVSLDYDVPITNLLQQAEYGETAGRSGRENYDRALHQLRMAAKIDGIRRSEVLKQMSDIAQAKGDTATRIEVLKQLDARNEIHEPGMYNDLSMALLDVQRTKLRPDVIAVRESMAYAHKALEVDPKYAPAYCNLGVGLLLLGEIKSAADCFRSALEIDPSLEPARRGLEYVGSLDANKGRNSQ